MKQPFQTLAFFWVFVASSSAFVIPTTPMTTKLSRESSHAPSSLSVLREPSEEDLLDLASSTDLDNDKLQNPPMIDWKTIKTINNMFWDYTCNFLYVAISMGIVLNLFGYGYNVSLDKGLQFYSFQELRQERQFQLENARYQHEYYDQQQSLADHQKFLLQQSQQQQQE